MAKAKVKAEAKVKTEGPEGAKAELMPGILVREDLGSRLVDDGKYVEVGLLDEDSQEFILRLTTERLWDIIEQMLGAAGKLLKDELVMHVHMWPVVAYDIGKSGKMTTLSFRTPNGALLTFSLGDAQANRLQQNLALALSMRHSSPSRKPRRAMANN